MAIWLKLIAANIAVFLLQLALPTITPLLSFTPSLLAAKPWSIITAIFAHGSVEHLFFNMWALFVFGSALEQQIGEKKFLLLYLLAGIAGNVAFALFYPATLSGLGASGAIFGIIGALAMLAPNLIVIVFFAPMPLWLAAIVWTAIEFVSTLTPNNPVANFAHLAGLAIGLAAGKYLKKQFVTEQY